ncbi:hypothetical protein F5148DRAFT_25700 [Russula earlei]|uniref:Uncharacterized protein n=1 Tax=Russula earlei TaxID=71964 RepID=A0ACC0TRK3_9AGAM|nr:hypothetical protein F5148DRAFT_25700 [Russula earlei]
MSWPPPPPTIPQPFAYAGSANSVHRAGAPPQMHGVGGRSFRPPDAPLQPPLPRARQTVDPGFTVPNAAPTGPPPPPSFPVPILSRGYSSSNYSAPYHDIPAPNVNHAPSHSGMQQARAQSLPGGVGVGGFYRECSARMQESSSSSIIMTLTISDKAAQQPRAARAAVCQTVCQSHHRLPPFQGTQQTKRSPKRKRVRTPSPSVSRAGYVGY